MSGVHNTNIKHKLLNKGHQVKPGNKTNMTPLIIQMCPINNFAQRIDRDMIPFAY